MAFTKVASVVKANGAATSYAFTHGLTILEDDILVLTVHADTSGNTVGAPSTGTTSEWNTAIDSVDGIETTTYASFWCVSDGAEGSQIGGTLASSQSHSVIIDQYRSDNHPVVADAAVSSSSGASAADAVANSIDVAVEALAIAIAGADSGSRTFTAVDNSYLPDPPSTIAARTLGTAYRTFTSGGSTGAVSMTLSSANAWNAFHYSLKDGDASGGGSSIVPIIDQMNHLDGGAL